MLKTRYIYNYLFYKDLFIKTSLIMIMNEQDRVLLARLNQNPQLRQRMEELLNIVENTEGGSLNAYIPHL